MNESDAIVEQVETGYLPPTIEAIKAAKEAETGSLSPEITAQLDTLQRKVAALTQQRDTLSSRVRATRARQSTGIRALGGGTRAACAGELVQDHQ
jgi:uncharacterized protein involved in exopolysaccharide biosynthesis